MREHWQQKMVLVRKDASCILLLIMLGSEALFSSLPPISFHMLIFTGHSRKWRWQPRFEVTRGPGVKHFLLTWKHIQAHLALGICRPLPRTICTCIIWGSSSPNKSHVLITFEGVMTSGPQPILIWFQSWGPESRLHFRPPLHLLLPARFLVACSAVPLSLIWRTWIMSHFKSRAARACLPHSYFLWTLKLVN